MTGKRSEERYVVIFKRNLQGRTVEGKERGWKRGEIDRRERPELEG